MYGILIFFGFIFITFAIKKLIISILLHESVSKAMSTLESTLIIPYTYRNKKYKLILPFEAQSKEWTTVDGYINEEKFDITEDILEICGPNKNFFNLNLTLNQIIKGYDRIKVNYDNYFIEYSQDDVVTL